MYPVRIDNFVFWLHYKVTSLIMIVFAVLTAVLQWFGDPIFCYREGPLLKLADIFCKNPTQFASHNSVTGSTNSSEFRQIFEVEAHYLIYLAQPWFILSAQAFYFYVPYSLWKNLDGGKFRLMMSDLNRPSASASRKTSCKNALVNYLATNLHKQNRYALQFCLCEVLNFINVFVQLSLLHYYIGYDFGTTGIDVLLSKASDKTEVGFTGSELYSLPSDCYIRGSDLKDNSYDVGIFPDEDLFCVIPLASEYICVVLWFWLICLMVISAGSVLSRMVDLANSAVHLAVMRAHICVMLVQQKYHVKNTHFGAWFLLNLIRKNVSPEDFEEIVSDLTMKVHQENNLDIETV